MPLDFLKWLSGGVFSLLQGSLGSPWFHILFNPSHTSLWKNGLYLPAFQLKKEATSIILQKSVILNGVSCFPNSDSKTYIQGNLIKRFSGKKCWEQNLRSQLVNTPRTHFRIDNTNKVKKCLLMSTRADPSQLNILYLNCWLFSCFLWPRNLSLNQAMEDTCELDLVYVTERIIAVNFASLSEEQTFCSNLKEVAQMLKSKHGDSYLVRNLEGCDSVS